MSENIARLRDTVPSIQKQQLLAFEENLVTLDISSYHHENKNAFLSSEGEQCLVQDLSQFFHLYDQFITCLAIDPELLSYAKNILNEDGYTPSHNDSYIIKYIQQLCYLDKRIFGSIHEFENKIGPELRAAIQVLWPHRDDTDSTMDFINQLEKDVQDNLNDSRTPLYQLFTELKHSPQYSKPVLTNYIENTNPPIKNHLISVENQLEQLYQKKFIWTQPTLSDIIHFFKIYDRFIQELSKSPDLLYYVDSLAVNGTPPSYLRSHVENCIENISCLVHHFSHLPASLLFASNIISNDPETRAVVTTFKQHFPLAYFDKIPENSFIKQISQDAHSFLEESYNPLSTEFQCCKQVEIEQQKNTLYNNIHDSECKSPSSPSSPVEPTAVYNNNNQKVTEIKIETPKTAAIITETLAPKAPVNKQFVAHERGYRRNIIARPTTSGTTTPQMAVENTLWSDINPEIETSPARLDIKTIYDRMKEDPWINMGITPIEQYPVCVTNCYEGYATALAKYYNALIMDLAMIKNQTQLQEYFNHLISGNDSSSELATCMLRIFAMVRTIDIKGSKVPQYMKLFEKVTSANKKITRNNTIGSTKQNIIKEFGKIIAKDVRSMHEQITVSDTFTDKKDHTPKLPSINAVRGTHTTTDPRKHRYHMLPHSPVHKAGIPITSAHDESIPDQKDPHEISYSPLTVPSNTYIASSAHYDRMPVPPKKVPAPKRGFDKRPGQIKRT